MAKQFLTGLDLNKNELLNARIQNLSSAPSSPVSGQVYYNTSDNAIYLYDGSAWQQVAIGADAAANTDELTEGSTNLYFTDERAQDAVATALTGGTQTNITVTYDDANNTFSFVAENGVADSDTDDLTEGATNLYYTDARVDSYVSGSMDTDDLSEGATNLYYTDARARGAVSSGDDYIAYNSGTGVFTLDTANAATVAYVDQEVSDVNNTINGLTTTDISEGSNQYYTDARARGAVSSGDNTLSYNSSTGVLTANTSTLALKSYVDSQVSASAQGLDVKGSVRVATTANITLSGTQTIDGVSLSAGDRVLVKDQTDGTENGLYVVVDGGAWTRTTDADSDSEVTAGLFTFVTEGTSYADTGWVVSTNDDITVGTTAIAFTQFSGAGQYSGGDGLTLSGTTFAVGGTTDRITVSADAVDIASTYEGQSSIVTVGTITTGTWNGDTVAVDYGGTGATSLTGYISGNGTSAFTASSTIPVGDLSGTLAVTQGGTGATTAAGARSNLGATTKYAASNAEITPSSNIATWTVSHNLDSSDTVVSIRDLSDDSEVMVDVVHTDANTITLTWTAASTVAANSYRVVVVG